MSAPTLLRRLLTIGIDHTTSKEDTPPIRFINGMSLLLSACILPFVHVFGYFEPLLGLGACVSIAVYLGCIGLNAQRRYDASGALFLFNTCATIGIYSVIFGPSVDLAYVLVAVAIYPFVIFGHKDRALTLLGVVMACVTFFVAEWLPATGWGGLEVLPLSATATVWFRVSFQVIMFLLVVASVAHLTSIHISAQRRLKKASEQLRTASEAKSHFLASMSHELRTPLTTIIGYAEFSAEQLEALDDPRVDQVRADIDKIRQAGEHLTLLVSEVLDLSKIEAGRMHVVPEPVDVDVFLWEVRATVEPLIVSGNNTFTLTRDPSLDRIIIDPMKFKQITINLLSNAAKFTEDGEVALRLMPQSSGCFTLEVEDTGAGIAPEAQAKIFEPFEQETASTSSIYGGTGLGLALVKNFAELMGGEVALESEVARGSRFRVTLPREVRPS